MQTQKMFLIIFIVYCLGFFGHAALLKQTVYGDGIYYYSWIRSVLVDGDVDFTNEYAHLGGSQPETSLGKPGNKYTPGPAMLWMPTFAWTHTLVRGQGYELPYQLAVGFTGVLYVISGLVLLFILLRRYFSEIASTAATLAISGATNLFFYGSIDSVNSHAVSFFAVTLFLTFLFAPKKNWLAIGCTLGLVGLMRTQDLILVILVIPFIKPRDIFLFLCGTIIVFTPQLLSWQALYGTFLTSPYISNIEGFNFFAPNFIGVLFSAQNGLLLWTPIVLFGLVGLQLTQNRMLRICMTIVFLLELYLVASWSIWWQGASYSGRMFVSTLPLIAFGLAGLFTRLHVFKFRTLIAYWTIVFPLIAINFVLMVFFLLKLQ
jgi:hypothetical protein